MRRGIKGPSSGLLALAWTAGMVALAWVLLPQRFAPPLLPAIFLGAGAALLTTLAIWAEQRGMARRGFVLYFLTERLRLEGASSFRGALRTYEVSFDAARAVEVAASPRRSENFSWSSSLPTTETRGGKSSRTASRHRSRRSSFACGIFLRQALGLP